MASLPYLHHQGKPSSSAPARPPNAAFGRAQGQFFFSHALGTSSPAAMPPEPAPLSCPIKAQVHSPKCCNWQLSCSHDLGVSSPDLLQVAKGERGHLSYILFTSQKTSGKASSPMPTRATRSTVLPKWGSGPTLLSAGAGERQGQLSHSRESRANFLGCWGQ